MISRAWLKLLSLISIGCCGPEGEDGCVPLVDVIRTRLPDGTFTARVHKEPQTQMERRGRGEGEEGFVSSALFSSLVHCPLLFHSPCLSRLWIATELCCHLPSALVDVGMSTNPWELVKIYSGRMGLHCIRKSK